MIKHRGSAARRAADRAGRDAEAVVAAWLAAAGWTILGRRVRGRRGDGAGEIDIVALDPGGGEPVVVFIEVKARPTSAAALEAVTHAQRRRLALAADGWLATHPEYSNAGVRFDVITVTPNTRPVHLPDAWRPEA